MPTQHRLLETPVWAARLLRGAALLSFVLLIAMTFPAWRSRLGGLLGISFGVFWCMFGLFTFTFNWVLPLRGGGIVSPHEHRWLWLMFSIGTVILGCTCVFFSAGQLRPLRG